MCCGLAEAVNTMSRDTVGGIPRNRFLHGHLETHVCPSGGDGGVGREEG